MTLLKAADGAVDAGQRLFGGRVEPSTGYYYCEQSGNSRESHREPQGAREEDR